MDIEIDRFIANALVGILVGSWTTWAVNYWSDAVAWLALSPALVRLVLSGLAAAAMLWAWAAFSNLVSPPTQSLFFDRKKRTVALKGRAMGLILGMAVGLAISGGVN